MNQMRFAGAYLPMKIKRVKHLLTEVPGNVLSRFQCKAVIAIGKEICKSILCIQPVSAGLAQTS